MYVYFCVNFSCPLASTLTGIRVICEMFIFYFLHTDVILLLDAHVHIYANTVCTCTHLCQYCLYMYTFMPILFVHVHIYANTVCTCTHLCQYCLYMYM